MELNQVELDMFLKYPFMQKRDAEKGWSYSGFVEIKGNDYNISIQSTDLRTVDLKTSPQLNVAPKDLEELCASVENQSAVKFLDKLLGLDNRAPHALPANNADIYRRVLSEYSELLQFHINIHKAQLSHDLREIDLSTYDERRREHRLLIGVKYDRCGDIFTVKNIDLPEFLEKFSFPDDSSLISLYDKFAAEVESPRMQAFLDFMQDVDRVCWVLDPVHPSYKDTYRRICLTENTSVVLTYSSLDVKNMPNIRFLGPKHLVSEFEDRLNTNYLNWDTSCDDPLQQILIMLGLLDFPQKPEQDSGGDCLLVNTGECCICFQMRLDEQLPEITCPNLSCNQVFHITCLYQWLSSLNTRRVYYEICDKCPNCEKLIHCPVPTNLV